MFTIKFYKLDGRLRILSAESFTVLRDVVKGEYEITLHQKDSEYDRRFDIKDTKEQIDPVWPERFDSAIIENANGRTTEILNYGERK